MYVSVCVFSTTGGTLESDLSVYTYVHEPESGVRFRSSCRQRDTLNRPSTSLVDILDNPSGGRRPVDTTPSSPFLTTSFHLATTCPAREEVRIGRRKNDEGDPSKVSTDVIVSGQPVTQGKGTLLLNPGRVDSLVPPTPFPVLHPESYTVRAL